MQSNNIRMGEMQIAAGTCLLRTLLGSCVGLAIYDRHKKIGGLAHIMLPTCKGRIDRPGKYADLAIPLLIESMRKIAESDLNLTAKMAGGASMFSSSASAGIGAQNITACRQILQQLSIPLLAHHCGGEKGRRMLLDTADGRVVVEIVGQDAIEL